MIWTTTLTEAEKILARYICPFIEMRIRIIDNDGNVLHEYPRIQQGDEEHVLNIPVNGMLIADAVYPNGRPAGKFTNGASRPILVNTVDTLTICGFHLNFNEF